MTVTIVNHEARATRGDGLRLVPSQRTERIQATDPPKRWEVSRIERITDWYVGSAWAAYALLVLGCAMLGAAIVLATWMVM
jgi:hypothetical protein